MSSARPRIAIAGLGTESSTFTPGTTLESAFVVLRGDELFGRYPSMAAGSTLRESAQWLPILVGDAMPGAPVALEAFENLSREIVESLEAGPAIDGLFYDIHGAMSVVGLDDPESDLLERIRAAVGPDVLISASMDLHGNVSRRLVHGADLITCYRMTPHEDTSESRERAIQNLLDRLVSGAGRPLKAWIPVPVLLPGEKTSTRLEPGKSIYAAVEPAASVEGILDAAIWIGYAWADGARNRAAVVVTGDDEATVSHEAEALARSFWDARDQFEFVAPAASLEESLDAAVVSRQRPFFISDSGDNPTAGGSGDVTWSLTRILERPEFQQSDGPSLIYASIPGREAVALAMAAGVGAEVTVTVGALVDNRSPGPLTFTGVVHSVRTGDPTAKEQAVIRVGSVYVIVTALRKPFHKEADFLKLALEPRAADIVVVKIGYLEPELFEMSEGWLLALTPGGVDQDLLRLEYSKIRRPMFPFDAAMADPDLRARLIPASNAPLLGEDE